jgi:SAM-dependent methyltransferase
MVTKDDVIWCYRNILEREPESSEAVAHFVNGFSDVRELLKHFFESDEYGARQATLDAVPANPIELDLSPAQRQSLWDHIGRVWRRLGATDPYWSVLAVEEFRLANMTDGGRVELFYDSGRWMVERVENYLAGHGRRLPERGTCVDFGCGVGRVTPWLARRCGRVLGFDVSPPHLDLARARLAAAGADNVSWHVVAGPGDLALLHGIDFFHSIIALQHNPPPLIVDILSAVFEGLNPGGCAFFQVPTYATNYRWQYDHYLRDVVPAGDMEMHVLPQAVIFDLAAKFGCRPLEVQPDKLAGLPNYISNTFLFTKPAAA